MMDRPPASKCTSVSGPSGSTAVTVPLSDRPGSAISLPTSRSCGRTPASTCGSPSASVTTPSARRAGTTFIEGVPMKVAVKTSTGLS